MSECQEQTHVRVPVLWVAMRRLIAPTDTVDDDSAVSTTPRATFGDGVNQGSAVARIDHTNVRRTGASPPQIPISYMAAGVHGSTAAVADWQAGAHGGRRRGRTGRRTTFCVRLSERTPCVVFFCCSSDFGTSSAVQQQKSSIPARKQYNRTTVS